MPNALPQTLIQADDDPRLAHWLDQYAPDRAMAIMSLASRWLRHGGRLRIRVNSLGFVVPTSQSVIGARLVCPSSPRKEPALEFLPGRLRRSLPLPDDIEDFVDSLETFGAIADRSRSSWRLPISTAPQRLQTTLDALADLCRRP